MSYAVAWCYRNMTKEQFSYMSDIDQRNGLTKCPFVNAFKNPSSEEGPLVRAAHAYRDSPAWFTLPQGEHTGELRTRSPLRGLIRVKRFNTGQIVVGEFQAR